MNRDPPGMIVLITTHSYAGDRTFEEFAGDRICLPSCSGSSPPGRRQNRPPAEIVACHPAVEWRKNAVLRVISVHSCYAVKPTIFRGIIRIKLGPLEEGG